MEHLKKNNEWCWWLTTDLHENTTVTVVRGFIGRNSMGAATGTGNVEILDARCIAARLGHCPSSTNGLGFLGKYP